MYQSIPSLTTSSPPGQTLGEFFEWANSPPPGHKESAKPLPLGQNNHTETPTLRANIFTNSGKTTKKLRQKL